MFRRVDARVLAWTVVKTIAGSAVTLIIIIPLDDKYVCYFGLLEALSLLSPTCILSESLD